MKPAARYEKIRARLFLAMGLGGTLAVAPACTEHGTAPPRDAATADAPPGDGGTDAPITVRRPFLIGASLRSSAATRRDDWAAKLRGVVSGTLDPKTAAALGQAW